MQKLFEKFFENNGITLKEKSFSCEENELQELSPITHIHAFCFLNSEEIVIFKQKNGTFAPMAGGGIEGDETFEEALRRELIEEGQLDLVQFKILGFTHITSGDDKRFEQYSLKAICSVKLIDKEIEDPAEKVIGREIISMEDMSKRFDFTKTKMNFWQIALENLNN